MAQPVPDDQHPEGMDLPHEVGFLAAGPVLVLPEIAAAADEAPDALLPPAGTDGFPGNGVHRFRIARGAPDDNYFLPALLLAGDFLADGAALRPRTDAPVPFAPLDALGLGGFVGTATWTARVRVPKETLRSLRSLREKEAAPSPTLRVQTGGAPAEAFWNGARLGVRLRAPFEWTLPASAAGTEGELSIAVSTSVAPMFGAPDAPGAAWDQPFWTPPRAPEARFGLLAAGFSPSA